LIRGLAMFIDGGTIPQEGESLLPRELETTRDKGRQDVELHMSIQVETIVLGSGIG
jgi:hypothetical protein